MELLLRELVIAMSFINATPSEIPIIDTELLCLSKSLYFESRGETPDGQIGAAWVHLNRVADPRFPNTVCENAMDQDAFSWFWDGQSDMIEDWEAYQDVAFIAANVLAGNIPDNTNGATHYFAHDITTPYWFDDPSFTQTTIIDGHTFMLEGDRNLARSG